MLRIKYIGALASLFIMPFAHANVDITMTQAVAENCDGITSDRVDVLPGDCIMYRAIAINNMDTDAFKVTLRLKIPKYTRLEQFPIIQQNGEYLNNVSYRITRAYGKDDGLMQASVPVLKHGSKNAISVEYSVRVMD